MTDLNRLYSAHRLGYNRKGEQDPRTVFQRDFDRIIFSSPFRRLQNKTQVFPLPGSVFVHNRLTHSLEVASVGRSLGTLAGGHIASMYAGHLTPESIEFYRYSLSSVIAAASLCHDIGNPAFGHSGEDAIASYFIANESALRSQFEDAQWNDFIHFEGNANAIRVMTHQQNGKTSSGFDLTVSTLAAIAKYPCESAGKIKGGPLHRKKFGFFQGEIDNFNEIAEKTSMIRENDHPLIYKRHPFVWLVEAADDICYNIIDLEDAHRLHIVEHNECRLLLITLLDNLGTDMKKLDRNLSGISNRNEKISFLRAITINALVMQAIEIYKRDFEKILSGDYSKSLFDTIGEGCPAISQIIDVSIRYIYNHRSVVEIENAGYNVMSELLSQMIPPVLAPESSISNAQKKAAKLIPEQFRYAQGNNYQKVMGVLDFVSGMTDNYATDLYKKIKGIDIGMSI